jgi:hypothetical protein
MLLRIQLERSSSLIREQTFVIIPFQKEQLESSQEKDLAPGSRLLQVLVELDG